MKSNRKTGRIVGLLFLFVFIIGVLIFQILQGPILFSEDFLTSAANNSDQLIASTVLGILNGVVSIVIAVLLLPIFLRCSTRLAYLYLAFCILNFCAIMIDNLSVTSMLELSKAYVENTDSNGSLGVLESLVYERHFWTHYFHLLISCLPVFVLYYIFFITNLIPRVIAIFGMIAVVLMSVEILFSIFGNGISMNLLLPMGLVQLALPFWLIFKGLDFVKIENGMK